jgi:hypothetical protein
MSKDAQADPAAGAGTPQALGDAVSRVSVEEC